MDVRSGTWKTVYQGYNVNDIVDGLKGRKFGFEETIYLLLFGRLPSDKDMEIFKNIMENFETLSGRFVRDVVMKASNGDIMNAMQRCILTLYTYDSKPEDISAENVLRQSIEMIAKLPLIAVYSYHSYRHFRRDETLFIRNPQKGLSLAENILLMLRPDGKYTELEAKVLDIALILHAEHGGGNNSTFTTHVVTSSGTDTYSSIAASIGSLKGPRHGGANLKVQNMFEDIEANVKDWTDEKEVEAYLRKILNKEAFDHTGLIYGMGHAVYTLSDPREVILKRFCQRPCTGEGNDERICPLRTGRTSGRKNGHGTAETFQKCLRKRRLLQWFRIYYAWNPQRAVYTNFRNCTYSGMERTSS